MAKTLTPEDICRIEHDVMGDFTSVFELDKVEDVARKAVWAEGVRDMAVAIIDAMEREDGIQTK